MGNHDYITISNGIVSINCMSVPDKGFINATMTKDIAKIKFLSSKDKCSMKEYTPGGPDVIVNHITGEKELITRRELAKHYTHASGNKIKISVLKNDKWYIVYAPCSIQYKMIKLPNNCSAMLTDGSPAKRGYYIICKQDENGEIIRETMQDIAPSAFRKMFRVPMQPVIKRALEKKHHNKEFTLFSSKKKPNVNKIKPEKLNNKTTSLDERADSNDIVVKKKPLNIADNTLNTNKNTQNNIDVAKHSTGVTNNVAQNKYRFTVVNRLTDMDGKLIGYVLMEISTQRKKNVKPNDLARFCAAKTVDNVMLVTREDGVQFLKGNGIRLENLPAVLL